MTQDDFPKDEAPDETLQQAVNDLLNICEELETSAQNLFDGGDIEFSQGIDALATGLRIKLVKRYPSLVGTKDNDDEEEELWKRVQNSSC